MVNATFGWRDWCTETNFKAGLSNYFLFPLSNSSKMLIIYNVEQLLSLPKINNSITSNVRSILDSEKSSKEYDAIEIPISENFRFDIELYGWDCNSILVLNHNVVIPIIKFYE